MLQEARNRAYGIGQGQELGTIINKGIITESGPCDYCSTIEGESELSRSRSIGSVLVVEHHVAPSQKIIRGTECIFLQFILYVKGKDMILSDFLSRQETDKSDLHEIIPISFDMKTILNDRYYNVEEQEGKYLVQT